MVASDGDSFGQSLEHHVAVCYITWRCDTVHHVSHILQLCAKYLSDGLMAQANAEYRLATCVDADDVVQEVFVKYHFSGKEFESERHIHSWLCKVAVNLSRNRVKCFWRSHKESIEEYKKLKQAVITQAVTKGVRGDRPMKDSGIEWIGEIPEEWEEKRIKYLFSDIS